MFLLANCIAFGHSGLPSSVAVLAIALPTAAAIIREIRVIRGVRTPVKQRACLKSWDDIHVVLWPHGFALAFCSLNLRGISFIVFCIAIGSGFFPGIT